MTLHDQLSVRVSSVFVYVEKTGETDFVEKRKWMTPPLGKVAAPTKVNECECDSFRAGGPHMLFHTHPLPGN